MEERREANKQMDHDLLIVHSGQLTTLCKGQADLTNSLQEFINKIDNRCDTRKTELGKTMTQSTFWKILTMLSAVLVIMVAFMNINREMSLTNKILIIQNAEMIKLQIEETRLQYSELKSMILKVIPQ